MKLATAARTALRRRVAEAKAARLARHYAAPRKANIPQVSPLAVRRYAATNDDLHALFGQIHPSTWHGELHHDTLPRLIAADMLDDLDRPHEAQLMRSRADGSDDPTKPLLPVYLDNGVVRPVAALRSSIENRRLPSLNMSMSPSDRDYLNAALWSSMDNADPETGGEPLDANYGIGDIHPATLAQMIADNRLFHSLHGHLIGDNTDRSGHDFWLTRNGHDTGFWDDDQRYYPHHEALSSAADQFGEYDLSVGDDGMIHGPTHGDEPPDPRDEGLGPDDPNYTGGMGGAHYARQARVLRYAMEVNPQDIAGFHRAIHDRPGEDLPHLAYADMLEESGHPAEAAVIRNAIRDHVTFWGRPRRAFETDPYYQAWYGNEPDMTPEDHEFHSGPRLRPGEFHASATDEHGDVRGVRTHHQIVRLVQRSAAEPDRRMVWEARVPYPEGQNLVQQIRAAGQPADPGEGPWAETPTPQNYPPPEEDAAHLARRYAAYRAPVGGVVVRGLAYKGGQLIPDLKTFLPPEKLDRLKARARKKPKPAQKQAAAYQRARQYAAVRPDEVHPDYRPTGVAARVGRVLSGLAAAGDEHTTSDTSALAEQILREGDHHLLPILHDSLQDSGHPLTDHFDWQNAPRGIVIDKALNNMIAARQSSGSMLQRSRSSPGWFLADWKEGARSRLPRRTALAGVREQVPDATAHDLHHSILRLVDLYNQIRPAFQSVQGNQIGDPGEEPQHGDLHRIRELERQLAVPEDTGHHADIDAANLSALGSPSANVHRYPKAGVWRDRG